MIATDKNTVFFIEENEAQEALDEGLYVQVSTEKNSGPWRVCKNANGDMVIT